MKASLFSFVAAVALFATTAASAAPINHDRDLRRMSPRERARYEQAQRDRARYEQAQRERERERQQAIERARWEAQHRNDRGRYGRH
jgi:Ni/Co efflux regulator RcnB